MALTNQTNVKEISDGGAGGLRIGQSATDKIGFFGLATPVVQQAAGTAITATATETATIALVIKLRAALVNLGLIA